MCLYAKNENKPKSNFGYKVVAATEDKTIFHSPYISDFKWELNKWKRAKGKLGDGSVIYGGAIHVFTNFKTALDEYKFWTELDEYKFWTGMRGGRALVRVELRGFIANGADNDAAWKQARITKVLLRSK